MKIALTYNLRPSIAGGAPDLDDTYIEWDEFETIAAVRDALAEEHQVVLLEVHGDLPDRLTAVCPDLVFNMAEGFRGPEREARVPALLEKRRIPFTGSSAKTLRICLDKGTTKEALLRAGIPTPAYAVVYDADAAATVDRFPLIVKPLHEGSSKGISGDSVVQTPGELRAQIQRIVETYDQPALVEAFLPGREFTVALLGNGPRVGVLPLVEIRFEGFPRGGTPVYSYEAKWLWDSPERPLDIFRCPAKVSPRLGEAIAYLCRRAFAALQCRDWCRIDVRLDAQGRPHVLEANPLPGILPRPESHSCFPAAAAAAGIPYPALIRRVVRIACQRYGLPVPGRRRTASGGPR
jgi:D-alanine-D-alanine ligase